MGPAEEAAKIALFVLHAATAAEPGNLHGYRIDSTASVFDLESASGLLAMLPRPLSCSARVQDDVLVLHCGQLSDPKELAVHARQSKYLSKQWREEFGDSAVREPDLELRAGTRSMRTTLSAWYDFLASYQVAFTAGVPVRRSNEQGSGKVLIISRPAEIRIDPASPP